MKEITVEGAYTRAAALCSRSEHTVSDIKTKLAAWGLPASLHHGVIERLIEDNFINEARYAHAFVHDKLAYNGWGRIKIVYQLRARGVAQVHIDNALEQIDQEDYRSTLVHLLQGKWREVQSREPRLARAAMLRFAASRGFEPALVMEIINTWAP